MLFRSRVMEALQARPDQRVLEVGAGSGYATAILARLGTQVVSFERYRTLATEASVRLRELGLENVRVIHGDGLAPDADIGVFDRIILDGAVADVPPEVMALLARDGIVIFAREDAEGRCHMIRRADEKSAGLRDAILFPCRAMALARGKSTTF